MFVDLVARFVVVMVVGSLYRAINKGAAAVEVRCLRKRTLWRVGWRAAALCVSNL